ncbi:hypothetical protein CRI94_00975 [Longibacter salinarum]|uniref:Uncharacterized protein n=2 Tax=Longibacter salinarum TaxID=1850348 RepID=A0A2A8D1R5_9BACT|nr:hypothetical protein CRI94_00975 [Longibacter salinarum]
MEDLDRVAKRSRPQGIELVIPDDPLVRPTGAEPGATFLSGLEGMSSKKSSARPRWLMLPPNASDAQFLYWQQYAHVLRAGLVVQRPVDEVFAGVRVAITHGTSLADVVEAVSWARDYDAHTCWEIGPGACDSEDFDRVLEVTLPYLAHVRLLNTDPEVLVRSTRASHVDVVMRMLARRQTREGEGYSGTIALVPSATTDQEDARTTPMHASNWRCCTAA